MISCDHCGKIFTYPCFLEKHLTRKIPCFMKSPPKNVICQEIKNQENSGDKRENTANDVGDTSFQRDKQGRTKKHPCTKCDKTFYNRRDCEKHIEKCKSCHVLQCHNCLKKFSSYSTKSEHIKNVKCKPPEPEQDAKNIQNNVTINNNITNNITNNINIVNWSNETYAHMTPDMIADIVRKCVGSEQPLTFFSEFPTVAHRGEHKNLQVKNIRGNYVDVYEDGRFLKLVLDTVLEECAKRMIYRLEDAMGEDENAFNGLDTVSATLIRMEDVVHGIPKKEACEKQLKAMDALEVERRSDVLKYVKNGLRNSQ